MSDLEIARAEDAERVLDHFNGFHDGFVAAISLHSHDAFEREGPEVTDIVHRITGTFDVVMEVAHYNYAEGTQPHDRVVLCVFEGVSDFHLDLRAMEPHSWPLQQLSVEPLADGGFSLGWAHSHLVDGEWERRAETLFRFERARFEEDVARPDGAPS